MKRNWLLWVAVAWLGGGVPVHAGDAAQGMPYNAVNESIQAFTTQVVDGVACVALYLKDTRPGATIVPATARLRVVTWEGTEIPLKVEALASLAVDRMTEADSAYAARGFTHRVWIPKNDADLFDGRIVHSLPKGSLAIAREAAASPLDQSRALTDAAGSPMTSAR